MMGGKRVRADSNSGIKWESVIESGVRGSKPEINALASKSENEATVMIWNYHDDELFTADTPVEVVLSGIPSARVIVKRYLIDKEHSNSYEVWKKMGSPQNPDREQYTVLEKSGQLQSEDSPVRARVKNGKLTVNTKLLSQSVELIVVNW
jgi:xylan 1,4-beta-xylosidase